MKLKLRFLFAFILFSQMSFSQASIALDLVSTSGNFFQNENVSISYSVGEIAINTLDANSNIITQGFQQSKLPIFDILVIEPSFKIDVSVYPNPAGEILFIKFKNETNQEFFAEIYTVLGEKLIIKELNDYLSEINIDEFNNSLYLLKIRNSENQIVAASKIYKK